MKYGGLIVCLSVVLLASGAYGTFDIFKGWGVDFQESAGVGGVGYGKGFRIGNPDTSGRARADDYSSGTGAGVGGTLSLGPLGSVNVGVGVGAGGRKPTGTYNQGVPGGNYHGNQPFVPENHMY
ncbi:hypothetical protein RI129_012548 [Pyrocoelia pectoralis]|uniref:Uncharacterized protein n=1 Tax=Pyrocoelia pectoralis TaxID=417401 RepID=A0AAN7V2H7_9COLE